MNQRYSNIYPEELWRAESSYPEEEALGRRFPHAGHDVENVGPRGRDLHSEELEVMPHSALNEYLQLHVSHFGMQSVLQVRDLSILLLHPVPVLHLKRGDSCTWMITSLFERNKSNQGKNEPGFVFPA